MKLITRTEWDARPAKKWNAKLPKPVDHVVIHHTVTPNGPNPAQIVRAVQNQHLAGVYHDIAYNYLAAAVTDHVFVGRGSHIGGATGGGVDNTSISVACIDDLQARHPTPQLETNLVQLLVWLVNTGRLQDPFELTPHREHHATLCPGDNMVKRLKHIKDKAMAELDQQDDPPPPVEKPKLDLSAELRSMNADLVELTELQQSIEEVVERMQKDLFRIGQKVRASE